MKHRETHPVDDMLRRATERLTVGNPDPHWEVLRNMLDQALPATPSPPGQVATPESPSRPGPAGWWWRGIGLLALGAVISLWWWSDGNAAAHRQEIPDTPPAIGESLPSPAPPDEITAGSRTDTRPQRTGQPPREQAVSGDEGLTPSLVSEDAPSTAPAAAEVQPDSAGTTGERPLPIAPADSLRQPERPGKKKKFLFW